jgi:hypothetical protein
MSIPIQSLEANARVEKNISIEKKYDSSL